MIDFHSHILPAVDDGSKDTDESLKLLSTLCEQGIDTVVATPHFDAEKESVEEFILRRQDSYNKLNSSVSEDMPKIILGAEVAYYDGISSLEGLDKLCIEGTNLLLLEMPMCRWSEYALGELKDLSCTKGYTVLLAHIERYMGYQPSHVPKQLSQLGILMQVNASYFTGMFSGRKAIKMLCKGEINAIGSDCHNTTTRSPQIGAAFEVIRNKLGEGFVRDLTEYHRNLLTDDIG